MQTLLQMIYYRQIHFSLLSYDLRTILQGRSSKIGFYPQFRTQYTIMILLFSPFFLKHTST